MKKTLFIAAHPDDIETMMAYAVLRCAGSANALVATDGEETTLNYTNDPTFIVERKRKQESERGLACLGLTLKQQTYLGLPDGNLTKHLPDMTEQIITFVNRHDVFRVFTLGRDGYDNHPDHVATHNAAETAIGILNEQYGKHLTLLALNNLQGGSHALVATEDSRKLKLAAMSCHKSQFVIAPFKEYEDKTCHQLDGFAIQASCWKHLSIYHPLILQGETYDLS